MSGEDSIIYNTRERVISDDHMISQALSNRRDNDILWHLLRGVPQEGINSSSSLIPRYEACCEGLEPRVLTTTRVQIQPGWLIQAQNDADLESQEFDSAGRLGFHRQAIDLDLTDISLRYLIGARCKQIVVDQDSRDVLNESTSTMEPKVLNKQVETVLEFFTTTAVAPAYPSFTSFAEPGVEPIAYFQNGIVEDVRRDARTILKSYELRATSSSTGTRAPIWTKRSARSVFGASLVSTDVPSMHAELECWHNGQRLAYETSTSGAATSFPGLRHTPDSLSNGDLLHFYLAPFKQSGRNRSAIFHRQNPPSITQGVLIYSKSVVPTTKGTNSSPLTPDTSNGFVAEQVTAGEAAHCFSVRLQATSTTNFRPFIFSNGEFRYLNTTDGSNSSAYAPTIGTMASLGASSEVDIDMSTHLPTNAKAFLASIRTQFDSPISSGILFHAVTQTNALTLWTHFFSTSVLMADLMTDWILLPSTAIKFNRASSSVAGDFTIKLMGYQL